MHEAPMPLGVTIQPLGRASEALDAVASLGLAGVQFDASDPELRPREMSESARRDLVAALRRRGLAASGVDCFVPIERFVDPARVERAMEAVRGSIALAESLGRVPVCLWLPAASVKQLGEELVREAQRRGVPLADFTWPDAGGALGIDPAAVLSAGGDPCAAVSTAGSRVAAARVVDLLQGGLRGPIGQAGACRLDALAYRLALEVSGFQGLPVIDCRQWTGALEGVRACADRWVALLPTVGGARP